MGEGRPPQKSLRLLRSRSGTKKEYLCVCVCMSACKSVYVSVCVFPQPHRTLCMYACFCKKEKK